MISDLISIGELVLYILAILAISIGITALVVKISPSSGAKAQQAAKKNRSA